MRNELLFYITPMISFGDLNARLSTKAGRCARFNCVRFEYAGCYVHASPQLEETTASLTIKPPNSSEKADLDTRFSRRTDCERRENSRDESEEETWRKGRAGGFFPALSFCASLLD